MAKSKRKQRGAKSSADRRIPTLSLFSGAGGLDLGFLQAGFDILACVEIEPSFCATLQANVGAHGYGERTQIVCQDIGAFDPLPFADKGIRCVIGGPPCQTFSAAGRRSGGVIGLDDSRGRLFQAYCRVLDVLRPEVFVFENVYGLPGANGGRPWREICSAFSKRGYTLRAEVVDAADYGVPQHRERLIMVGVRDAEFVFPMPTHGPDSDGGSPLASVREAIAVLQDAEEGFHGGLGGMYGHLLPDVPEGLNYSFFTAEMGHPEPVFAWRSKFHDLLYKVDPDEPCRTLKANPGKFTGPFHWKNRHFTVPELKRLQTFPDDYELGASYANAIRQIGNSVPPRLAYVIAQAVKDQVLAPASTETFKRRSVGFVSTFRQRQRLKNKKFHASAKAALMKRAPQTNTPKAKARQACERYGVTPNGLFDRDVVPYSGRSKRTGHYDVRVFEVGSHIDVFLTRDGCELESRIELTGLKKYMKGFDTLTLNARVDELEAVFHGWQTIEDALIKRSRFFTLIDIYGHYANRGDTVGVKGIWELSAPANVLRALNFFSDTQHCGGFVSTDELTRDVRIKERALPKIIGALRDVRFDVRNNVTHPIIGEHRVLCTYPFPLLSPRAMVVSKAKLTVLEAKLKKAS